jgi:hypothetical protein
VDTIPLGPLGGASVAVSELVTIVTIGDVDFYPMSLLAGQVVSAMTAPLEILSTSFDVPDTMLGLFDSSGTLLLGNDDAGDVGSSDLFPLLDSDNPTIGAPLGSAIRALITTDGTYYLGVTGFGDDGFIGDHTEAGRYALLVGVTAIPEASAMVLPAFTLAFLIAGAARRRYSAAAP